MRLMSARTLMLGALAVLFGTTTTFAAGWGSVKGKIVLEGAVPAPTVDVEIGKAPKDSEVCAATAPILNDSLVIGKDGGIANVVVYLDKKPASIHPDLKEPAEKEVVFDNVNCVFVPHVLVVRTDQAVKAVNSDACGHNVKTNMIRNKPENQLLVANDKKGYDFKFKAAEMLPMKVECNIHAWMTAFWFVIDHPYAVVTDAEGNFEIKNLPEGDLVLKIWQERAGYLERSVKVSVKDGQVTDLGELKFALEKFKAK